MIKKDVFVIKRDGTKVPYDVCKIKKSIAFATDGKSVNPLQLESSLDQVVKTGVKTSAIQENVIRHALQLATAQDPQWVNVAGRALAMQLWADFKLRGKSFYEIVQYNIKKNEYSKDLNQFYSQEDMTLLGEYIEHERDLEHSHSSLITVKKKYLGKYELNQHMHMVTAMRFGQLEAEENRLQFVREAYDELSQRKISLATPFMANLRKGGNVASCFIISIADDLDSIFENVHRIAKISKNGGGLGIYLGNLRAKGSSVAGADNAAGTIVQWVKIINDTLVAVNQSFVSDTLIETDIGNLPISSIKEGMKVKTHNGEYKAVIGIRSKESSTPILEISTSLGKTKVTSGHPVLVVKRNDMSIEELKQEILNGNLVPRWIDASELSSEYLVLKAK